MHALALQCFGAAVLWSCDLLLACGGARQPSFTPASVTPASFTRAPVTPASVTPASFTPASVTPASPGRQALLKKAQAARGVA